MKYKTNDTFLLRDVNMLQLNSYSFHTMASDFYLGNHPLLRCKSCEHQMLQPIDLQLTPERVTYVQPIHKEATKAFSFNISPRNSSLRKEEMFKHIHLHESCHKVPSNKKFC